MSDFKEPVITINGTQLTEGQAVTVRVALCDFSAALEKPRARRSLGPIRDAYKARVTEIIWLIVPTSRPL